MKGKYLCSLWTEKKNRKPRRGKKESLTVQVHDVIWQIQEVKIWDQIYTPW